MNITKTFVNKPTTVLIIFVVLVGLGLYATMDLPLDLLPDMELPYVAVMCSYPGAGPEEVENCFLLSKAPSSSYYNRWCFRVF